MITKTLNLDYYDGKHLLPEGSIRFSASQMDKLINKPYQWYRENILGEEGFIANTSSILGTIIHAIAEAVVNDVKPNKDEIEEYIESWLDKANELDLDLVEIDYQVKPMSEALVNKYILPNKRKYVLTEPFILYKLKDNYYVGGSVDAIMSLNGSRIDFKQCLDKNGMLLPATKEIANIPLKIIDYKTSSGYIPKEFPMNYKYQLITYAYILTKLGYTVQEMELVYVTREKDTRKISEKTGKPIGKVYPSEIKTLTTIVTKDDLDFIESILYMNVDALELTKKYPEYTYIIWRDPRLKQ